jgi:protoporphyrinogen oxidase
MVDALDNEDLSPLAEDQRRQGARNPVAIQANCTCSALTLAQRREEIALATLIRNQVRAIEPNEPVNQAVTMDEHLSNSVAGQRFQTLLLGIFAADVLAISSMSL